MRVTVVNAVGCVCVLHVTVRRRGLSRRVNTRFSLCAHQPPLYVVCCTQKLALHLRHACACLGTLLLTHSSPSSSSASFSS